MIRHLAWIVVLAGCSMPEDAPEPPCVVAVVEDRVCTMQYDPVCGCDGKTYGNACVARANGVQRHQAGACGSEPALD